ncbi:HlyD family type I secretion periplasmic adaptor subunit [Phreatobacter sp. AB_2022a]|uniref:HlyD family type I secretion periplasmic adaptor subunit n=1 Tax=Phreatobacter sp. AB_2022a TaxID=3003134 RepID=UPI002286FC5A|nr:HlyD family type I secretion periplasmic adaptor subunit [Phreatobacter sp. AB_2022a]MCZ0737139.1 HlyD family type I secretion periplasmic adaptor subunit [Phreatobacter sp. AB_2022a]
MTIDVRDKLAFLMAALPVARGLAGNAARRAGSMLFAPGPDPAMDALIRNGMIIVAGLVGGLGVWAATVPLSGAVVASGTVVADTYVKTVQHPTGGVIGEIRVRETAHVTEGDVLMRLDDTVIRANLQVVVKQIIEAEARMARLEAERDGLRELTIPSTLEPWVGFPDVVRAFDSEKILFRARLEAREGQTRQFRERIDQIREEITGIAAQEQARRRQAELIDREVADIGDLFRRNLVPRTRLVELEREQARLKGDVGQFVAERARAQARITETELLILQIGQDLRREVSSELRDVQGKLGELVERRVQAEDALKRIEIRAPQSGIVHQLAHHTVGGVIPAGQQIMQIVPGDDDLVIEIRVQPQDIEKVVVGRAAHVRLTALPHGTTPEVEAKVLRVSADVVRDPNLGTAYYTARVALRDGELARLGDHRLVQGMPAEVYVRTGDRTALAYLMKPIGDQLKRAFREK